MVVHIRCLTENTWLSVRYTPARRIWARIIIAQLYRQFRSISHSCTTWTPPINIWTFDYVNSNYNYYFYPIRDVLHWIFCRISIQYILHLHEQFLYKDSTDYWDNKMTLYRVNIYWYSPDPLHFYLVVFFFWTITEILAPLVKEVCYQVRNTKYMTYCRPL